MITHNLGYPRIGDNRELKKAVEGYWSERISYEQLIEISSAIKQKNWLMQKELGIDLIPSNDFSLYDHVLDLAFALSAIPDRYSQLLRNSDKLKLDLYFAMARGCQDGVADITAMEMTKWFDTNYHYIVPEFYKNQKFWLSNFKFIDEFQEAKKLGIITKPVILGPVSFLLLGKEKEEGFDRIDLLGNLLEAYFEMISLLVDNGVEWIQFDEPFLALDLTTEQKGAFKIAYSRIRKNFPTVKLLLSVYFGGLSDNVELVAGLPVDAIHLDLVRDPAQLEIMMNLVSDEKKLSLGLVDGRNIWKNNYENSLKLISRTIEKIGLERVMLAPSCSLIHVPCDLELETNEEVLSAEIKQWLAFAKQKVEEVVVLKQLSIYKGDISSIQLFKENQEAIQSRKISSLIHNDLVKERIDFIEQFEEMKRLPFSLRKKVQQKRLELPAFPTTTIGSFPQTADVRSWRAKLKKRELSSEEYNQLIQNEIENAIRWQEEIGLDVLVHGEFERNDMVEYFGEMLDGFVFTSNGWVQSYGSRCVKPPIIFGDVQRPNPMTVNWITYAQSLTSKPVKGMLTGPVTILKWSFVRDDQPLSVTCNQIALAIRDEVLDLEKNHISVIQIDEPALREGLPLQKSDWKTYLDWAVNAFRLSYAGVKDQTQIHTHMCYSEFNDIIDSITALDADVITIECSRSQMELLDVFGEYKYPNDIGPGVYDIHSPRVPSDTEMVGLLKKAMAVIPKENIWVNPDCGLKTRKWEETKEAIKKMVNATKTIRESVQV
ncbi:5-methyltetrahydropteroyltriglutamate--homocysteine methyltransferase [Aquipluma nitroreducens]|uniref:5-methyltetrahydropteroyltriglutamate--homocysteine methyltransferase n=1 Tax=Aquipluma nitroreducens TaxID=2010828 RepID=A0A5K7SEZ7_9BACT|nr:5-methyltetrahydropteroyltriglutamate--homocysteine S-methyltransferase [Aquipluma nitroreducens]BBE20148.1 5-methyltetrahydropteroyltriglutamate--homocysteine methyltransferase [Aquipluma nitroreducens]